MVLWDLREPVALHTRPPGTTPTSEGLVPRPSTFSTGMRHYTSHGTGVSYIITDYLFQLHCLTSTITTLPSLP